MGKFTMGYWMDWILSLKPRAGKSPDLPVSPAEITAGSPPPSIPPDRENRVLSRSRQGSYLLMQLP